MQNLIMHDFNPKNFLELEKKHKELVRTRLKFILMPILSYFILSSMAMMGMILFIRFNHALPPQNIFLKIAPLFFYILPTLLPMALFTVLIHSSRFRKKMKALKSIEEGVVGYKAAEKHFMDWEKTGKFEKLQGCYDYIINVPLRFQGIAEYQRLKLKITKALESSVIPRTDQFMMKLVLIPSSPGEKR